MCVDGIILAPAGDRIQKVLQVIQQSLQDDCLAPAVAQRLTGKLNFISTTLFGQPAAAAMKPLYSRAHDCNSQTASQLNQHLRCALRSLQTLLRNPSPRWIPFEPASQSSAVLYADAFFELGDKSFGLSDEPPENWYSTSFRRYGNGWGFVVRSRSSTRFAHGSVPHDVLALFTSRRAYIYCLEITGQILAAMTCRLFAPRWFGDTAEMLRSTICWLVSGRLLNSWNGSHISSGLPAICFERRMLDWCIASLARFHISYGCLVAHLQEGRDGPRVCAGGGAQGFAAAGVAFFCMRAFLPRL